MNLKLWWNLMNCGASLIFSLMALMAIIGTTTSAAAQTFKVLHTFRGGKDGIEPNAGLLLAPDGLYGNTYVGGGTNSDVGTVFKIDKKGYTVLYRFPGCCDVYPNGAGPEGTLIRDAAGNLYGTTFLGGAYKEGAIFKLDPSGQQTVLHSFDKTDGSGPRGPLVMDASGNLYGTTEYGGDLPDCSDIGCGTIFKLDPAGNLTVLYIFNDTFDGVLPVGNLVLDRQGNLYGIASQGGSTDCVGGGCGTLYRLDTRGTITILHVFHSADSIGCFPFGGVIRDQAGNIYGTTDGCAGGDNGTVFKLDPHGQITALYNFKGGSDGSGSAAPLLQDSAGNLYGTTEFGGDSSCHVLNFQIGCGTVFKLDTTGYETVLYRFHGKQDGAFPMAGLVRDAAGNLYSTAPDAGDYNCQEFVGCGVVFEVTP